MPRKPESLKEVRYAAGKTSFLCGDAKVGPFRILHEKDEEAGVWISSCLEHFIYTESDPGVTLLEAQGLLIEAITEGLNQGDFLETPSAPPENFSRWEEIINLKTHASDYGAKVQDVLAQIRASGEDMKSLPKSSVHLPEFANNDLDLAA